MMVKFRGVKPQFVLQALLGVLFISGFMFLSNRILGENILACMGATMFIVMTMPQAYGAKPRYLIGGYCCGCISGIAAYFLKILFPEIPSEIIAGIAVGLAIFLGTCLSFEHPPSGALAFGVSFSNNPFLSALIMLCCIIILSCVLHLAKKKLKNLLT